MRNQADLQLSASQRAAVLSDAPAIVVVASAGSGKTEVATQRVERLLEAEPDAAFRILAISYTVKAADELTERLRDRLGALHERVDTNTVHGFAHELLREHGTRIGLPLEPEVLTRDEDRAELFTRWLGESGELVPDGLPDVLRAIDLHRARLESDWYVQSWNEALASVGALDYEAMLSRACELLELPSVRRHMARLYGHILVDEAQNLTPLQYRLISTLAGAQSSEPAIPITLVGDDKQSIVSFAGADPRLIAEFESDFRAERFELAENFRSASAIVRLGESVARQLGRPTEATVVQYAAPGSVEVAELPDERSEGEHVAGWVVGLIDGGLPTEALAPGESAAVRPNEIAVLGRSAASLRATNDALQKRDVPVAVAIGPDEWLSTVEAKILFETIALRSAGTHRSTHWQLARLLETDESRVNSADTLARTLSTHTDERLRMLADLPKTDTPHQFIERLESRNLDVDDEQWVSAWDSDRDLMLEAWRVFIAMTDTAAQTWGNFRVFVARVQRGAQMSDGVRLHTIHKSQGQEYKAVAVVGINDGQLPDFRADAAEEQQSELRTFYVAVSRPTRVLLLTRSQSRLTRYGVRATEPSPYLRFV